MSKTIIIAVVVAILAAGGGFFAGTKYQQNKIPTRGRAFANVPTGQGARGGQFRPVSGEIINTDATSITIKLEDGSSKIVILSDSTTVNKSSQVEKTELKQGETVTVIGQTNSDGSVTAQTIQMGSMFAGFRNNSLPTP